MPNKIRHKEHFNLYSLPNIIIVIKIRQEIPAERKCFGTLNLFLSIDLNS
jgi:hypothetical protein